MVGVGVGVADSGPPPPPEPYYGEYYPEQFYVPQEMCPHPQQHPQHAHMCQVHTDYGGMPAGSMMPQLIPTQGFDENMRHYALMQLQHHQPHHQPQHHQLNHQPPHHQQPHHYTQTNGAGGPPHFYNPGFQAHYHPIPPHPLQHYPPPPVYQKDERTRQIHSKLKQKLERKHNNNRNNGIEVNSGASGCSGGASGASTPSLSPRKELNGTRAGSSGAWSEGEGSSAGASLQSDEDCDTQAYVDQLAMLNTPQVSELTPTSALVQWNSPPPESSAAPPPDLTFDLLLGERGGYKAIYSGPKLSCRVCDLRPGSEYAVRLQVRAGGGAAVAASEESTFRAPAAPPARPAPPRVASRARTALQLRWQAAADRGARLDHYVLECDSGEGWRELARPRTKSHALQDLEPQTRYRFRLAAVNECGRGEWSDETVAWTAGAPPAAPPPPRLDEAAPRLLALCWDRVGAEEFTLQCADAGSPHGFLPVYSGHDTRHACADLRRATDYTFRLRRETDDGQGPWSAEVTYRTLPERPGPPGRPQLRGKAHSRAFRLKWEPPAEDGGATVDLYTLELDDGGGGGYREAYCGREREAACERLRPGHAYRARVRATSAAGAGAWSAPESVSTEPAPPAPPAAPALQAPPRAGSAHVRWGEPTCCGGAPVTEYRAELRDEEAGAGEAVPRRVYSGADTECVVRELRPGARYTLTVCACNRVGASEPAPPLSFRCAAAPPAAPPAPAVRLEEPRAARVTWSAPADNGAPLQDYRLEVSPNDLEDAFAEVYRGPDRERLVDDLTPFTAYFFRVCASNAAGRGAWSPLRDVLTARAPPAAPPPPRAEPTATELRLAWAAPFDHGAEILRYRVRVDDTESETPDAARDHVAAGLRPDTAYRVRVAAVSELGVGEWSEPLRARTRPPPPPPPALEVAQAAHNFLKLRWDAAGGDDAQYRLEARAPDSREFRLAYRGPARSCKVKRLREASEYAFRIRASDERGGLGEWGAPLLARTPAAPPPPPRAPTLTVEPCGRRLAVAWQPAGEGEHAVQVARAAPAGAGAAVWRVAWSGAGGARCVLDELEPGAEYLVRISAARGGCSPAARALLPAAAASAGPAPPSRAPRTARPRARAALAPRQAALLLAGGFLVLAVLVAVLVQRLVEPRP